MGIAQERRQEGGDYLGLHMRGDRNVDYFVFHCLLKVDDK